MKCLLVLYYERNKAIPDPLFYNKFGQNAAVISVKKELSSAAVPFRISDHSFFASATAFAHAGNPPRERCFARQSQQRL